MVRCFEDAHRFQRRPLTSRVEQEYPELAASRRSDECPKQVGSSGERHLSLRLVADDAEHSRQRAAIRCLGQKPALPAARVADDDGSCDLASARCATDFVDYAELVYASDERAHV